MNRRANEKRSGGARFLALLLSAVMLLGLACPTFTFAEPAKAPVGGGGSVSVKSEAEPVSPAKSSEPAEESAEKLAEKPAEKPAAQPAEKPVEKAAEKPAEQPAEKPVAQPAEKPVEKAAAQPAEKAAVQPAGQPSEKTAGKTSVQPAGKSSEQPANSLPAAVTPKEEANGTPQDDGKVTITFMISDPDYTNDPDAHWTHLTVPSIPATVEGSGLHFEPWGPGTYKVLGTGALAKIQIPKGTSLEDNGLWTPDLSVTNVDGDQPNRKSYIASYSWITEGNMICSERTVFREDTVLHLSLYTNQSVNDPDFAYSFSYVVGRPGPGAISFGWSNTIKLGQSLSAGDIPGREIVESKLPPDSHKTFISWQLKDRNTNTMVNLKPGLKIEQRFTNPEATVDTQSTILVYARLVDTANAVTATFVSGGETVETRTLAKGDALEELPDASAYVPAGKAFLGWRYESSPGHFEYATPETKIKANTSYEAVYGTPQDEGKVTITFMISNPDYTNDPDAHWTHLTVPSIPATVEGSGLHFEPWGNNYKILGTGALAKIEIPKGTSLEDNGLRTPELSVTNASWLDNFRTYIASRSWITADNMICSMRTVFHKDTVLYLSLYTNQGSNDEDAAYSLNYTCPGIGSIRMQWSNTFKLGQSVSAGDIPDKAAVDAQLPPDSTKTFSRWQLKDRYTGDYVNFKPGMPIEQRFTNPDASADLQSVIVVYAKLVDKDKAVTATFVSGGETIETRTYAKGEKLEDFPDASDYAPQGQILLGWRYDAGSGSYEFATPETKINANTTYEAVYGAPQSVTVHLHDVAAYNEPATERVYDMETTQGTKLAAAMSASGITLEGGASPADCVWYTVAGTTKTKVNPQTVVTGEMHLYTYTYQAKLTLTLPGSESQTLTVQGREGKPLSASDFVSNGVDFARYRWTSGQTPVDVAALIRDGLTANVTATSDGTLSVDGMTAQTGQQVRFYVFLDGERKLLKTETLTAYTDNAAPSQQQNRRYLSADQLAAVYGEFGFTADKLKTGTKLFPHTATDGNTLWTDAAVIEKGGVAFSPITKGGTGADVYYFPKQSLQENSAGWERFKTAETFYTVKVEDPDHRVYSAADLPDPSYVLNGNDITKTVLNKNGAVWECVSASGIPVIGTISGNNTSFAISKISMPYTIRLTPPQTNILYQTQLPQTPVSAKPTIQGGDTYRTTETAANHTVLAPSATSYFYESEGNLGLATFQGWTVGNTPQVVQPGSQYAIPQGTDSVTFTAKWGLKSIGPLSRLNDTKVNFYVGLEAISEGDSDWKSKVDGQTFTTSVHSEDSGVKPADAIIKGLYARASDDHSQFYLFNDILGASLETTHQNIVDKLSAGYRVTKGSEEVTYSLSFPQDEDVLQKLRELASSGTEFRINGKTITSEMLTTDNFKVCWYVFKAEGQDGWHINGALVAKSGSLTIKKSFAGTAAGIESGKNGFEITVQGAAGAVHGGKTLRLNDADVSYDSASNTYAWTLPVDRYYSYTVKERSGGSADYDVISEYLVSNFPNSDENTNGWRSLGASGVTVTGAGAAALGANPTVALFNTYVSPGTVVLRKVDSATGQRISNGSFRLLKGGAVVENQVTTDATGQIYLEGLSAGTYTLVEEVRTGYDNPGNISFTLAGDPVDSITEVSAANARAGRDFVSHEGLVLSVMDYPRLISVEVHKAWLDGETLPVTLQLYRGGVSLGDKYKVTLDGTESAAWTHTFENLPLYVDGSLADYKLLETNIGGDTGYSYSAEYDDGYRYYHVEYRTVYRGARDQQISGLSNDVNSIVLTAENSRDYADFSFNKVNLANEQLPGAEFWIYALPESYSANEPAYELRLNEDGTRDLVHNGQPVDRLASAISDARGKVDFGKLPLGTYYMIERRAPEGYSASDTLWLVEAGMGTDGFYARMLYWDDGGSLWASWVQENVVNLKSAVDVVIGAETSGNMGDRTKSFTFKVVSDKPLAEGEGYALSSDKKTATFSLSHGEHAVLKGVPRGATLRISETNAEGYVVAYYQDAPFRWIPNGVYVANPDADSVSIVVNSHKDAVIDTGVILDNLPYILLLAFVGAGVAFLAAGRKRGRRER